MHNVTIWVFNLHNTCPIQIHMLWNDHLRVCQNLNKLHIGCLLQRGKQLCWMFCNPRKKRHHKETCISWVFSWVNLKKRYVSFISRIGQLIQIILIFICRFDQQKTKLPVYFIYPSLCSLVSVSTNEAINYSPSRV